jgi:hypothetical protein
VPLAELVDELAVESAAGRRGELAPG